MSKIEWHREVIKTRQGEKPAIAPIIISASRATDIPAFFSEWFLRRLQAGYIKWINPFNNVPQFVSLSKSRVFVFWTKNPQPFFPVLDELDLQGKGYYFHYTVNDYEEERFEPGIPALEERINTFIKLSNKIGRDKVIWRFDPLILTEDLDINVLLGKIERVGNYLHRYTNKLVVSLADIETYRSVRRRLEQANVRWKPFTNKDIKLLCEGLRFLSQRWRVKVSTCCESATFRDLGLESNSCIDPDLIGKLFHSDSEVRKLLKLDEQINLFIEDTPNRNCLKDSGQRLDCGCMISKDIGSYNTCPHGCIYCYANHGGLLAERKKANSYAESLFEAGDGKDG